MIRAILLTALVCLAAPLSAGALMDQLFDGKKPDKVAKAWFKGLPTWLNQLNKDSRNATSWFRDKDGKLRLYRIDEADATGLKTRELQETGKLDTEGKPERTVATDVTVFSWAQWETPWLAGTYPVESNESEVSLIGFAAWLYEERKAPLVANRVLTTVYLNEKFVHLREPIAEFIRDQEDIKKDTPLATFEVWDKEVRVFRTILIPESQADEFKAVRQQAARDRFMELHDDYTKPEKRSLTLAMLEFELKQWPKTFADTPVAKDEGILKLQTDLLKAIAKDTGNITSYVKAGDTYLEDKKPDKAAAEFAKALALDPCSLNLLSKTANASYQHAHPTLQETKGRVVGNENAAKAAMELYERWLQAEPANAKVILCLGQLHHLKGETDAAKKRYARVIELNSDAGDTKNARTLKKAADDNPKNQ